MVGRDYFPFGKVYFSGAMLVLGIVICRSFVGELKTHETFVVRASELTLCKGLGHFLGLGCPSLGKIQRSGFMFPP